MSDQLKIGIIGSGTMGSGIAQAAATAGFIVETLDTDPALVRQAYARIAAWLDQRVTEGKMSSVERDSILARLKTATSYGSLQDADCVIEAVSEDLALKRKVFAELARVVGPRTILATNTSSLSIARIGEGLRHAERFLGMHFFNPAPVMKLVELVQAPATSEQTMVEARAICTKLGKTPVKVKDSPGFIGNRVNRPFYLEALRLLEAGEADIRTIDTALKQVGGFKMGPFELLDLIGVDVNLRVTESVFEGFGQAGRFAPNPIQRKLVAAGQHGRKTGRGFYDYLNGEPTPGFEVCLKDVSSWRASPALRDFAGALSKPPDRAMWLYARILLAVVNEAALTADTIALPRDVDLTMQLGFNYPEGPLAMADHVGLDVIQRLLKDFHNETNGDERYQPNPLLDRQAAAGHLGEKTARGFLHHSL